MEESSFASEPSGKVGTSTQVRASSDDYRGLRVVSHVEHCVGVSTSELTDFFTRCIVTLLHHQPLREHKAFGATGCRSWRLVA